MAASSRKDTPSIEREKKQQAYRDAFLNHNAGRAVLVDLIDHYNTFSPIPVGGQMSGEAHAFRAGQLHVVSHIMKQCGITGEALLLPKAVPAPPPASKSETASDVRKDNT